MACFRPDPPEGREGRENMTNQGHRDGTSMPVSLNTKLNRLNEMAKQWPAFQFRTLAHLINEEMLTRSFHELRKEAAAGVDGVRAQDYGKRLADNIRDLHLRLREHRYRAQPLRRVYIPKGDGKQRPLSIPALEDKVVQKAVTDILSRIYEQDFLPCSYGYRPGRNALQAVQAIQKQIIFGKVSYILEADIQDYFGSVVRQKLEGMLLKRIVDKDVLRLIDKWLRAGILEDGQLFPSKKGVAQGSVISPLLANVYLHEVLDLWVEQKVKPRLRGEMSLFRYADDFVLCFQYREDAIRVRQAIIQRFESFGLKLNPLKTRLMTFGRFEKETSRREGRKPNTFDFLGFTFYTTEDRQGRFTVKSKTMSKRLRRSLSEVAAWCKKFRHKSVKEQRQHLAAVLEGHYQYYGIRANFLSLQQFYQGIQRLWKKWLGRRSQKAYLSWEKFLNILKKHPLPKPWITQGSKPVQLELFGSAFS
jgi:RNA-directed DNA polymerase